MLYVLVSAESDSVSLIVEALKSNINVEVVCIGGWGNLESYGYSFEGG